MTLFKRDNNPIEIVRNGKTFTVVSKAEMNGELMEDYRRAHPENDYLEIFLRDCNGGTMGIGYLYAWKRRDVKLNDLCGRKECLVSNPDLCFGCLGDEANDEEMK